MRRSAPAPAPPSSTSPTKTPAGRTAAVTVKSGSLDLWVSNAGILATGQSWEQDEMTRRAMLDVNALGTMNGTIAALEKMMAAGQGQVISVISLAGLVAAPGEVTYSDRSCASSTSSPVSRCCRC